MSKSQGKVSKKTLAVATDQELIIIDMTQYNGIAVQLNGLAATSGSMKLQHSNDQKLWEDIPSATSTLTASEANIINASNIYAGFVKVLVTLAAGPGEYAYSFLAKEH